MSQFYGSIQGQAQTEATRRGSKTSGITAHIRGWNQGVRVTGYVDGFGRECFEVVLTGGSNDSSGKVTLARIVDGKVGLASPVAIANAK